MEIKTIPRNTASGKRICNLMCLVLIAPPMSEPGEDQTEKQRANCSTDSKHGLKRKGKRERGPAHPALPRAAYLNCQAGSARVLPLCRLSGARPGAPSVAGCSIAC